MINVLITSMGSNTSIGVAKALRLDKDVPVTLIGTDTFPANLSAGSSFVDLFFQVPYSNAIGYQQALLDIIEKHKIHCVIPIHDLEIAKIAEIASQFSDKTFWAVNHSAIIELCNDKKAINKLLQQHQVAVPLMFEPSEDIIYPAIYKPIHGVSSRGIKMISNAKAAIESLDMQNGFLQQFVTGKEYTVDCYSSYQDDFFNCCVRERLETKDGISTKGMTVMYDQLDGICRKIHSLLNFKGASNIQFIVQDNIPYFIEINPRFSGAGILSYHAGFNSPLFTVLESIRSPLFKKIREMRVRTAVIMTRYWNENFYEA